MLCSVLGVLLTISSEPNDAAQAEFDKGTFCEERVPSLPNVCVSSVAVPNPLKTKPSIQDAEQVFHPIIVEAATRYKVDPALIKAIIMAESSYDPNAVSKKGAQGLMQLMPRTAEALGVEDTFNPEHNIHGGVKYLKQLLKQFLITPQVKSIVPRCRYRRWFFITVS